MADLVIFFPYVNRKNVKERTIEIETPNSNHTTDMTVFINFSDSNSSISLHHNSNSLISDQKLDR